MIKVEPCRGCGRLLYSASLGGLTYRAETEPLDAQEATRHLLGGGELYRVTQTSVSSATPAVLAALGARGTVEGPTVVRKHVCTNRGTENLPTAPQTPQQDGGREKVRTPSPKAPVAPSRRSSGQATASSTPGSAGNVGPRLSERLANVGEGPVCDGCGLIMKEGEYVSAQIGEIYVWATHLTGCVT